MKRTIAALVLVIVFLTLFLKGYYRVEMALMDYKGARDTLINIASTRYMALDSLIDYYRRSFSEESEMVEMIQRELEEFHEGKLQSIGNLENYIFNIEESLKNADYSDERVDSIKLLLNHLHQSDELLKEALNSYNRKVKIIDTLYSSPLYGLFSRFMIGRKPEEISIERKSLEIEFLPEERKSIREKEEVLERLMEEFKDSTTVDTLKKEEGEGDKSNQAGISTPGE